MWEENILAATHPKEKTWEKQAASWRRVEVQTNDSFWLFQPLEHHSADVEYERETEVKSFTIALSERDESLLNNNTSQSEYYLNYLHQFISFFTKQTNIFCQSPKWTSHCFQFPVRDSSLISPCRLFSCRCRTRPILLSVASTSIISQNATGVSPPPALWTDRHIFLWGVMATASVQGRPQLLRWGQQKRILGVFFFCGLFLSHRGLWEFGSCLGSWTCSRGTVDVIWENEAQTDDLLEVKQDVCWQEVTCCHVAATTCTTNFSSERGHF